LMHYIDFVQSSSEDYSDNLDYWHTSLPRMYNTGMHTQRHTGNLAEQPIAKGQTLPPSAPDRADMA